MYLKPSEVFFSQDSINNVFDKNCGHSYQHIGKTLDALCDGRCSTSNIPTISVVKHNNKWFTADNRRLWVFRNLERLGKCENIYVRETSYIPSSKFTTYNGGESVCVRNGSPGGIWHTKPSVKLPPMSTPSASGIPAPLDNEKENVLTEVQSVDETINIINRRPFQLLDNNETEQSIKLEITSTHSELDSSDSDTDRVSTGSSLRQSTELYSYENKVYLTSMENLDETSSGEKQMIPETSPQLENSIQLHVHQRQKTIDGDIPTRLTEDILRTNQTFSDPEKAQINIAKKCQRRCIILAVVVFGIFLFSGAVFAFVKFI